MKSFEFLEIKSSLGAIETSPSQLFADDDGRISQKTGISKIHRSEMSAYDLGVQATSKLTMLEEVCSEVKYLVYVTQSPSYFLPNHASRLQNEFGISTQSMCFDINQGCSGFVQALVLITSLLANDELGLIVCADTYSHHLSPDDRSTQVLFSDGATATVVKGGGRWNIVDARHVTDGNGADLLSKSVESDDRLSMDGAAVFQWTRRELGKQIKNMLSESGVSLGNIDRFYLHQASQLVLSNVIKGLGISEDLVPRTLHITGNLVSSSIPFLIEQDFEAFNSRKSLVMSGFGVGLSISTCLLHNAVDE